MMFALTYGKSIPAARSATRYSKTEARVTLIDGLLAVSVLVGLVLNVALGWW